MSLHIKKRRENVIAEMKAWRVKMGFTVSSAARAQPKIRGARQQVSQARKRLEDSQRDVETLEEVVSEQNQRIAELEEELEGRDELIAQLEAQVAVSQRSLS